MNTTTERIAPGHGNREIRPETPFRRFLVAFFDSGVATAAFAMLLVNTPPIVMVAATKNHNPIFPALMAVSSVIRC